MPFAIAESTPWKGRIVPGIGPVFVLADKYPLDLASDIVARCELLHVIVFISIQQGRRWRKKRAAHAVICSRTCVHNVNRNILSGTVVKKVRIVRIKVQIPALLLRHEKELVERVGYKS